MRGPIRWFGGARVTDEARTNRTAGSEIELHCARSGFSVVELVVALVVFTVGALAMAGTTGFVVRQVALGEVSSKRSAALQTSIERLRAMPFDSIGPGTDSVGRYDVEWSIPAQTVRSKTVEIVLEGPGLVRPAFGPPTISNAAVDTFTYMVVRP